MLLHLWFRLTYNYTVPRLQRPYFFSIKSVWSRFLMRPVYLQWVHTHVWNICCLHLFLRRWLLIGLYPSVALRSSEETQVPETERVYYLLKWELKEAGGAGKRENPRKTDGEPGEICAGEGRRHQEDSCLSHPQQVLQLVCSISASRSDGASLGQHGKWNCSSSLICSLLQITVMFSSTPEFLNSISGFG